MDVNEQRLRCIGQAIAQERERQGLSQVQLAAMLGYSDHAHLSRIEGGKRSPSMRTLFKLADILGVEVRYFFTEI